MTHPKYTSNLLPCPFCGHGASVVWFPSYYKVRCLGADCSAASGTSTTVEGAKALWNNRDNRFEKFMSVLPQLNNVDDVKAYAIFKRIVAEMFKEKTNG